MWSNPQFPADLVTFTGETLNGKLHFLWSGVSAFLHIFLKPNIANWTTDFAECTVVILLNARCGSAVKILLTLVYNFR